MDIVAWLAHWSKLGSRDGKNTRARWVLPETETYGPGMGLVLKKFVGMGLGDTRPDYLKPHTRLPKLYSRSYTRNFIFIFLFFLNPYLLMTYFSRFTM
ncbi:hypothetical protein Hanom_Chr16g01493951 [Helianthus anomalus]